MKTQQVKVTVWGAIEGEFSGNQYVTEGKAMDFYKSKGFAFERMSGMMVGVMILFNSDKGETAYMSVKAM